MATTPAPLVWDCWREVQGAAELGGVIHYDDEESQQLYLDGALQTRVASVPEGHWAEAQPGEEITLDETDYGATAWDHPSVGALYGSATENGEILWLLRYRYAADLGVLLKNGTVKLRFDSKVTQLSLDLKNFDQELYADDDSVFQPGAKLTVKVAMGDSLPESLGVFWLDDADYELGAAAIPVRGRNGIGYILAAQTFDEDVEIIDYSWAVVENILQRAGIDDYIVQGHGDTQGSDYRTWSFQADKTFLAALDEIEAFYSSDPDNNGYFTFCELPDGKFVMGYDWWIATYWQHNSRYAFDGGNHLIKRRTTRRADGAYTAVRVTGKDAAGNALTPVLLPVGHWSQWSLGAHKTKHVKAPDGLTQEELQAFAEKQRQAMQYVGVTESFTGLFRPWLLPGDVASVYYRADASPAESVDLGLITEVTHRFGENGFFTDFSVDSGGTETDGQDYIITRSAAVSGWNRRQELADLIRLIGI